MSITPAEISLSLIGAIALAVAVVLGWGLRTAPTRKAKKSARSANLAASNKDKTAKAPKTAPRSKIAQPPPPKPRDVSPLQRRYAHSRKVFSRTIDRRIAREPMIAEGLRRNRDLALTWYDQAGKVPKVRFQAQDARTACKICQGRNSKEYDLLKAEVIAQILPPCHPASNTHAECRCSISAVLIEELAKPPAKVLTDRNPRTQRS